MDFYFSTVKVVFLFLIERGGNFTLAYLLNFLNPINIDHFRAIFVWLNSLKMVKNDKKWPKNSKKGFW